MAAGLGTLPGAGALLATLAGALVGGLVQGVTGFGAGVVLMLVLPVLLTVPRAAAVSGAVCVALTASMAWRYRSHLRPAAIVGPAALYVVSSAAAVTLTRGADQSAMKVALGAFLVALAAYSLLAPDERGRVEGPAALACIVVSGFCDGAFGIGGPLMVLYYLSRTDGVEEYLGTIQGFFCVTLACATAFRLATGVMGVQQLPLVAAGVAGVLLGAAEGARLAERLDGRALRRTTYVVIGLAGALNVVSGVGGLL